MSSTGQGRLLRSGMVSLQALRYPIRQETANDSGLADAFGDYFWGGYPPTPTQIPYAWISPPARWRPLQPSNIAAVTRTGGEVGRSTNRTSVDALGERPYTATINTTVADDPVNLATYITTYYTSPRQRMPGVTLQLVGRSPTECWKILSRKIGDRISITGAPGSTRVLNVNPFIDVDASDWSGQSGATVARVTTFVRSGYGALQITPPGAVNPVGAATAIYPIVAGRSYTAAAWLFSVAGWSDVRACIDWYDASGVFLSSGLGSATVLPASVWMLSSQVLTAPAGAAGAKLRVRLGATPSSSDIVYADEITLTGLDGSRPVWPAGVTELVIEGIEHTYETDGGRLVAWKTAPVIGTTAGVAGPWFRLGESKTGGTDLQSF